MKIKDIMTARVEVLRTNNSLREAAEKMRAVDVGSLPVLDSDRVVGIVTDRDIIIRGTAEGRDPNTTTVQDVMTRDIYHCFPDDDVKEAVKRMSEKKVRRLLVMNKDDRLVGIASLSDLAVENVDAKLAREVLVEVSKPQPQHHTAS